MIRFSAVDSLGLIIKARVILKPLILILILIFIFIFIPLTFRLAIPLISIFATPIIPIFFPTIKIFAVRDDIVELLIINILKRELLNNIGI